jgi:formate C-acetyltransferase
MAVDAGRKVSNMDKRIEGLKRHIQVLNDAGVRRTLLYGMLAASLKRTQGMDRRIRHAMALAHLLDTMDLVVLPHETIAGSILGVWPLAPGTSSYDELCREADGVIARYVDAKSNGVLSPAQTGKQRWAIMARDHYDANIVYADLQRLIRDMQARHAGSSIAPFEIGRELENHFNFDYGAETKRLLSDLPWTAANHLDLNYGKAIRLGLGGIRDEIDAGERRAGNEDAALFHQAARITLDAVSRFVRRYADVLDAHAVSEPDGGRSRELRDMALACRAIESGRPTCFRDGLQLMWMLHVIGHLNNGSALSFARFDQYMRALYDGDVTSGRITRDQAREWISCVWLKVNEPKMRTVQSICLGGTTPDGQCGVSDLTSLCLEVSRDLQVPYPNTSVRVGRNTPDELYDSIVETLRAGYGQPMLLNDDVWIPNLRRFYPVEDARDYYNMGCVEIMLQGRLALYDFRGSVLMPQVLERLIDHGRLDSCRRFEDLLDLFCAEIRTEVRSQVEGRSLAPLSEHACDPFGSMLIDDCVTRGKDMYSGGSKYPRINAVSAQGLGTAVDSLSAIRSFVCGNGSITIGQLREALRCNFQGYEPQRRMLAGAPCFGNDIDEVDAIACRVFDAFADEVHDCGSRSGERFATVFFSYTSHVYRGEIVGATPNGRFKGEAISNGIGPCQGKDSRGPTCAIKSVSKLDLSKVTGALAMNLTVSPDLLGDGEAKEKFKALLKTYVRIGGVQIQVNVFDGETLIDAQKDPEKHRNLIVRVGGFSEYFANLDLHLQNEVISRMSQASSANR